MSLEQLYGKYEPQGLVAGIESGLTSGANLGSMFAQTRSANQQTTAREQKLPWELAGLAADADTKVQANDLTRATQTPEYLQQTGANALGKAQNESLSIEQIKKEFPLDSFLSLTKKSTLTNLSIMKQIRGGIQNGNIDSVTQMLVKMAPDDKSRQLIMSEAQKAKANPQAALKQLDDAEAQMKGLLEIDPASALKLYEMFLDNQAKMIAAQNSGRGDGKPTSKETEINNLAKWYMQQYKIGEVEAKARATADLRGKVENTDLGGVSFPTKTNIGGPGFAPLGSSFEELSGGSQTPAKVYDPKTKKWITK